MPNDCVRQLTGSLNNASQTSRGGNRLPYTANSGSERAN